MTMTDEKLTESIKKYLKYVIVIVIIITTIIVFIILTVMYALRTLYYKYENNEHKTNMITIHNN